MTLAHGADVVHLMRQRALVTQCTGGSCNKSITSLVVSWKLDCVFNEPL